MAMAAVIMSLYDGCSGSFLAAAAFLGGIVRIGGDNVRACELAGAGQGSS